MIWILVPVGVAICFEEDVWAPMAEARRWTVRSPMTDSDRDILYIAYRAFDDVVFIVEIESDDERDWMKLACRELLNFKM